MNLLFECLPLLVFFMAYKLYGIYNATLALIVVSGLQLLYARYRTGTFEKMPLFTFITVSLLGGATLLSKNQLFIQWKPTLLYGLFAAILGINQILHHTQGQPLLIGRLLQKQVQLKTAIVRQLTLAWIAFFIGLGVLNLYVAYQFELSTWVHFKLFGTLGLTLAFMVLQGLYLAKCLKDPRSS